MPPNEMINAASSDAGVSRKRSRIYLSIVLSIAVITAGVAGAAYIGKTALSCSSILPTAGGGTGKAAMKPYTTPVFNDSGLSF